MTSTSFRSLSWATISILFLNACAAISTRAPASRIPAQATPSVAPLHIASLPYAKKISVPGSPDWMDVGFGSLWAPMDGKLVRIDAVTNVVKTISIDDGGYRGVKAGPDAVWVFVTSTQNLFKVDPSTNTVISQIHLNSNGGSEGSIGVGEGSVWVVTQAADGASDCLSRIDSQTGKTVACIPIDADGNGVVVGSGYVFVTHYSSNQLTEIDPKTNQVVKKIKVGQNPRFITEGFGSIWTLNQGDGTVTRVDPISQKVTATIAANIPGGGGDIAAGEGYIWVTINGVPVNRIDPNLNLVDRRYEGGEDADAIRAGAGFIWVSDRSSGTIWKVKTNL